ncbi:DUF4307 domain-containing protein [Streptomyces sp. 891-h]|uniref:DUF4307 domain-containing protein n=1 Tax=Streptomyces sp. 891-h TaxID=2720714 RepID=UPI001FAA3BFB|nr:DUF4307 domain-containing protein [Streptomyces sp. 891-h]UNZ17589.1 DUF4307 domain-containing protein [Streptomyces sp. 891-h]
MVDLRQQVPEGRYGRTSGGAGGGTAGAEARTDRRLKITGGVLGVLLLALVGWIGISYVSGQDVSGEVIKWRVASDSAVQVHLEVRKDADVAGVCTLRARAENGSEVARKDAEFPAGASRVDKVVPMRSTDRATSVELVGCQKK